MHLFYKFTCERWHVGNTVKFTKFLKNFNALNQTCTFVAYGYCCIPNTTNYSITPENKITSFYIKKKKQISFGLHDTYINRELKPIMWYQLKYC